MKKTLSIHGNSLALIIEKPILDLLNIDHQTPLQISTDGKNIIITPCQPEQRAKGSKPVGKSKARA
ncbi:MAG: AbrB/MazE/SpoVT family DNA-binding domain-containing protein [Candidatus Omnitrophota bacterium]